jgi:hypothetical protein
MNINELKKELVEAYKIIERSNDTICFQDAIINHLIKRDGVAELFLWLGSQQSLDKGARIEFVQATIDMLEQSEFD